MLLRAQVVGQQIKILTLHQLNLQNSPNQNYNRIIIINQLEINFEFVSSFLEKA